MSLGIVSAGLQIGLESVFMKPKRGLMVAEDTNQEPILFSAQIVISEQHSDTLTITDHPVEFGSNISDHAFKRPATLVLKYGWSNSPAPSLAASLGNMAAGLAGGVVAQAVGITRLVQSSIAGFSAGEMPDGTLATQVNTVYNYLLALQASKTLFSVYTGKRFYSNMIIESLDVETDMETENAMLATIHCRQLIIANTSTVSLPQSTQANSRNTESWKNRATQQLKKITG